MIEIKNNYLKYEVERFNDGTMNIRIKCLWGKALSGINHVAIKWSYENEAEMIELMYLVRHLRALSTDCLINSTQYISLEMAYVPNARQDKVNGEDEVFTLKYFADFINWLNFDKVYILDPHSAVAPALINNCEVRHPNFDLLIRVLKEKPTMIVYADAGAQKRYSKRIEDVFGNIKYAFGQKRRNPETKELDRLAIYGDRPGPNEKILIIDDICSTGSTVVALCEKIRQFKYDVRIDLYVTHCEQMGIDSIFNLKWRINNIYTTDSLVREDNDFIIDISKEWKDSGYGRN